MVKRTKGKIERIRADAYVAAFALLREEVQAFMQEDPRFVCYYHMVGYGPSFETADGETIGYAHDMPNAKGRAIMELCDWFYDTLGAGNERIKRKRTKK